MATFRWQCDKCGSLHPTELAANKCGATCSQQGPECSCPAPKWVVSNGGPICGNQTCGKPMPRRKERREDDW